MLTCLCAWTMHAVMWHVVFFVIALKLDCGSYLFLGGWGACLKNCRILMLRSPFSAWGDIWNIFNFSTYTLLQWTFGKYLLVDLCVSFCRSFPRSGIFEKWHPCRCKMLLLYCLLHPVSILLFIPMESMCHQSVGQPFTQLRPSSDLEYQWGGMFFACSSH